ncbi:MAG: hypothetical protein H6750_06340 [Nitrospiraceae bacterium]|nr:hypothetical protein [Nitrospira sp.]MCA9457429.1 hypothetical protein [Nitrospira sp.]MCB9773931.1 hypothetical protein [Nitrospiraceae bacterium]
MRLKRNPFHNPNVLVCLWITLLFNVPIPKAGALPTVNEILQELHLSDTALEDNRQREIVNWSPGEGSDLYLPRHGLPGEHQT